MNSEEFAAMRETRYDARESPFHPDALSSNERSELDVLAFGSLRQAELRREAGAKTKATPSRVTHVHPRKA